MKKAGIILLSLLMPLSTAFAEASKPLSVELLWQLKRIGSPVVSSTGEHIIAPVTEYDLKEDKGSTQLWRFDGEGKNNRAITAKGLKSASQYSRQTAKPWPLSANVTMMTRAKFTCYLWTARVKPASSRIYPPASMASSGLASICILSAISFLSRIGSK